MRKSLLLLLLLPPVCMALDHEFLTPFAVVLKNSKPLQIKYSSVPVIKQGFWRKEEGLVRSVSGRIKREADITNFYYLLLQRPLKDQEKLVLVTSCGKVDIQYRSRTESRLFKLNQVGNGSMQKRKYAYLGAWLGSAGALQLKKYLDGKEFELRRASDEKCVFRNKIRMRGKDPFYRGTIPFTGEEVAELDYSAFTVPGRYHLFVKGIGRSMEFVIGSEALSQAFYIHARGLYHKRCGIAKTKPFTAWESPACHKTVYHGRFPGNAEHYRKGKGEKTFGFFDRRSRQRMDVRHFDLIRTQLWRVPKKLHAPGGWHDAADYDRRPYHLRIVSDLATVYLLKSENFIDGQLNIPESSNRIPDILDEAAWGLKHLLAVQQKDGGVGCWFETTGHPGPGEGLPHQEKRTYYVSAPSRNGTLQFAASASTLALALKKASAHKEAEKYTDSAIRAWRFAMDHRNRLISVFTYQWKSIFYREEVFLNGENLLITSVNLFMLTGDKAYLETVLENKKHIMDSFRKYFWRWSVLSWMCLDLYKIKELEDFRKEYRKVVLHNADLMLRDQESSYPYRTLWYAPHAGWVHAMAWGNYHPLRRAMTLIAAHALTKQEKYLTGAYLANDFHNGANPLGRSMTSGLGKVYPVVFLDLVSYADNIGEFVPGITPYGNTFGLGREAVKMVYREKADLLPVFRRYVNLEFLSVPASEYTVWETIAPAAVTTGYLLERPLKPSERMKSVIPGKDYRKLPGYRALP